MTSFESMLQRKSTQSILNDHNILSSQIEPIKEEAAEDEGNKNTVQNDQLQQMLELLRDIKTE